MPTPQERLVTEEAEFKTLVEDYNGVAATQNEKLQEINKKSARIELLKEQVADGD